MTTLTVSLKEKRNKGDFVGWEGTVDVPGLKRTKVARVKDGTTTFATTSAVKSTARALAKRLGLDIEFDTPTQKAAKKSVKGKSCTGTKTPCCNA